MTLPQAIDICISMLRLAPQCFAFTSYSKAGQHAFYITRHEGAKRPRASEIKSMLPSLVYCNWLIVMNTQKKHRSFAVQNSPNFRTFRS